MRLRSTDPYNFILFSLETQFYLFYDIPREYLDIWKKACMYIYVGI